MPLIMGAMSEIREALTNLIFTAVDALCHRVARLHVTHPPGDGEERHLVEIGGDTGVGMDEETRRRCLEPFFTTKGERGTGLGLAMVYGIMQRHGGDVEIDSAPASGTTVRAILHRRHDSLGCGHRDICRAPGRTQDTVGG